MEQLQLYIPKLEDLWFREKMMSDPVTMSYNKGWDVKYPGYHRDTGCVDFPREQWESWYRDWINREPQREDVDAYDLCRGKNWWAPGSSMCGTSPAATSWIWNIL